VSSKPRVCHLRPVVFAPSEATVANSQMTRFRHFFSERLAVALPDEAAMYRASVTQFREFWSAFLEWSEISHSGDASIVCDTDSVEHARFFPNVRLSYAENVLGRDRWPADSAAITALGHDGRRRRMSRRELADEVDALAGLLRRLDVGPGERVVALLGNTAESVIAALAVASVGATFSSAAPDMGVAATLNRFNQLDPGVFLVSETTAVVHEVVRRRAAEIAKGLTSLRAVVTLSGSVGAEFNVPTFCFDREAEHQVMNPHGVSYDFNHPLFVMFSSGTTGPPKCIVHGAGGTLLEHVKEDRLHGDVRAGEKLFFHTSVAWMMWNRLVSALACGAEIVLYDGPSPEPSTLWEIVAEEHVNVFCTSPPYLRMCEEAGYAPVAKLDLTSLRTLRSNGSILSDRQYDWVAANVGAVRTESTSGGTDIIGAFVLGNPNLPVRRGTSQCRSLGLGVEAYGEREEPAVGSSRIGELVCRTPFPSRPLGLVGDSDGSRFHAAYFSQHDGVWTHGDFIEIFADGSVRMLGRSDSVLNVRGFRIGPAEIYSVLDGIPEIREAMAVEQRTESDESRLVLLVVPTEGHKIDRALDRRIRSSLREQASPNHVPALIVEVSELPTTHSGKRSETAARDALNNEPVRNREALKNPECLDALVKAAASSAISTRPPHPERSDDGSIEQQLTLMWESLLGVASLGWDESFFELGGTSLQAARLFRRIADEYDRVLPLSTLLRAPTIRALARVIREQAPPARGAIELRAGHGGTILMAPGVHGNVLALRSLANGISCAQAIVGLQSPGLVPGQHARASVEEIAEYHLSEIDALGLERPYSLVGHSFGGLVAFEMAHRLADRGEPVAFLGLIDPHLPLRALRMTEILRLLANAPHVPSRVGPRWRRSRRQAQERIDVRWSDRTASRVALRAYRPRPYSGSATYFEAAEPQLGRSRAAWRRLVLGELSFVEVPGRHTSVMGPPHVADLAAALSDALP
jgi:acetoacetyl-CoA synthetase